MIIFIDDLKHLSVVRPENHNKFAAENEMASFLMSAKNGDQVNKAFFKIAATLAGNLLPYYLYLFLFYLFLLMIKKQN